MKTGKSVLIFAVVIVALFPGPSYGLEPLSVKGGRLVASDDGAVVHLFGINLFDTHLGWAMSQNIPKMEKNLEAIAGHGFNALRVPINMSYIEPAPDVYPDTPGYDTAMEKPHYSLKPGFMDFLDALVRKAAGLDMYVVLEFHELPDGPWRYFAGGDNHARGSGKHGGAISWLADDIDLKEGKASTDIDGVLEHVPRAVAWLACHYRGNPAIAAIEVPFNEPHGGRLSNAEFYYKLVEECASAIKEADDGRLVFMELQDWGACVNSLRSSSCWRVPSEIDALMPHYYFGLHCPNAPLQQGLAAAPAHWLSWFTGCGKPVLIGEYGTAGFRWKGWQKRNHDTLQQRYSFFDPAYHSDEAYSVAGHAELNRDVLRACVEQWREMGAQGAFFWAWRQGVPGRAVGSASMELEHGFDVLGNLCEPFKGETTTAADADIAVVCSRNRRSAYASPKDLFAVAQVLVEEAEEPYHVIFDESLRADAVSLAPYLKIIVLPAGLSDAVRNTVDDRSTQKRTIILDQQQEGWAGRLTSFLRD